MKILVSGGHLTPALAVIDYIQQNYDDQIIFLGRKYSQKKLKQLSNEKAEIDKRDIPFFYLDAIKINELKSIFFVPALIKLLISVVQTIFIIIKTKPDVYLSFGGYLALPVAIACYLSGVPVITHEQTTTIGTANKIIAKFSKIVLLSYPQSKSYLNHKNIKIIGNPIRLSLFEKAKKPSWINFSSKEKILYITGGSQGSKLINTYIGQILPRLTSQWQVIHQCGNSNKNNNYKKELEGKKSKLGAKEQKNYLVKHWISEDDLAWILQNSDLVISRAGANSISELMAFAKPAILIPLAKGYLDEQSKNAQFFVKNSDGFVIKEEELSRDLIWATIRKADQLKSDKKVS